MPKFAEVLVDVANRRLDQSYYYLIPDHMQIKSGMTVMVTLKNRKVQGLVVGVSDQCPDLEKPINLREIEAILEESRLPSELIELACWMAETTICSVAQALHTVWPFLKGKVEPWIYPLAGMDDEDVQALELLDPETYKILQALNRSPKKALAEKTLLKRTGSGQDVLEEMLKQGWIKKETRFSGAGRLKKTDLCPAADGRALDETGLWRKETGEYILSEAQKTIAGKIWEA